MFRAKHVIWFRRRPRSALAEPDPLLAYFLMDYARFEEADSQCEKVVLTAPRL